MNMVVKGVLVAGMTSLGLLAGLGAVKMQSTQNRPPNEIGNSATNAEPKASDVEWVEVDGLSNKSEIPYRPGNVGVVAAVADFIDGQTSAMRPELRQCAFPLLINGKVISTQETYNEQLRLLEESCAKQGTAPSNEWRAYNFYYKKLLIEEYVGGKLLNTSPQFKLSENQAKRLVHVAHLHGERLFVVQLTCDMKPLRLERKRTNMDIILSVAKKADGWRVVSYDP